MSAIIGETLIFGQQEGNKVPLVVSGDEFYARYETQQGYTVIYDLNRGCYCYAQLDHGHLVSTGTPISKRAPVDLRKHLKEPSRVRNAKFKSRYDALRPSQAEGETALMRTLGRNSGLLTGRQISSGNVKGLTILVEFQDLPCEVSKDEVDEMLNASDYRKHGNFCSVRQYYQLMSSGQLDYRNDVVGPVRLSKKQSHYINQPLMQEALDLAIDQFNINLSDYDSLNSGVVDALSFLYAGRTLYKNWLWPHNSTINLTRDGVRTDFYTIQSLGRSNVDLSIGTFAHETGHMLCRFPDLYDYGQRDGDFESSAGLGRYCLMSSGNHLNGGKTPSPICAYLRDLAGWCDSQVDLNKVGAFTAMHGNYGVAMRYSTPVPNEYFLVENRANVGLDEFLPDGGLAIYHCDTRGSNEYEDGTPEKHYQCALLQADGHRDLENDFNPGDQGDLFGAISGKAIADETNPTSRMWDGTDSGLVISKVSSPSAEMTFMTGTSPTLENKVSAEAFPDLIIPDNKDEGVTSSLLIDRVGALQAIAVQVDISHTYRGDLEVELVSPSGTAVILHSGKGGQQDDLHLDMRSQDSDILRTLLGEAISGQWDLIVRDKLRDDVGRLNHWKIELEYESTEAVLSNEAAPAMPIPDNDREGVISELPIQGSGSVTAIDVQVKITHPFSGDLQVELQSPSGQTALLRSANWRRGQDLEASYTSDTTATLVPLHGEAAQGNWGLRVRDLAGADIGAIDRWSLKLTVN
ncbi:M6 family metalloprotease domain-containing protein [Kaarinaea lacus]